MKFRYRAKSNEGAMVEASWKAPLRFTFVEALRTKGLFPSQWRAAAQAASPGEPGSS